MPNMSHCRFTNTLYDLRECLEHMDDDDLSEVEKKARSKLIRLCHTIGLDWENEIDN